MKKSWRNNVEFYLIGLLVLTVAAFSITMPEIFWSISNFQSVASQMPVLGILALAMAVTMLCGGVNLSIIATANACSLVMAWVATQYPPGIVTVVASLLAGAGVLASESDGMRFVRGGVVNPLMRLPRSNLLTVGYRIHDGYLERLAWPLTDAAGSVKPTTQKLIPADSLRLQFYDGTRWQESWAAGQAIPVAVRMTLYSPQWGEIERIWLLRGPQLS